MANETEDAEAAAERLEMALERIAGLAVGGLGQAPAGGASIPIGEIAARLDAVIGRIRSALDGTP
jgi:hypothetical protein